MIERVWIIASGLLLVVAAILLWRNNLSAAFVIAALGACAWFLSYRAQLREKIPDEEDLSEEPEVSTGNESDVKDENED
jgi:hypothetical protein